MRASRTHQSRLINYNDPALAFDGEVALQKLIANFVYGIRCKRNNPVSAKQIKAWFKSTDPDFVQFQIDACCGKTIREVNGAYFPCNDVDH